MTLGGRRSEAQVPAELYHEERWYACRTKSRAEKLVNRRLLGAGMQSYLPLLEQKRQWADRVKLVELPVFPGYIFARFKLIDIHEILSTPGVSTVVRLNGYPTPIADQEVESVRRLVGGVNETGGVVSVADYLVAGDPVVVTEGPFKDMVGVLVEVRGQQQRVVVKLSVIQQAVSVELEGHMLRPMK